MTFFTVPLSNQLPWQRFKITLSGVVYTLEFRYNTRSTRWMMNILDASGNAILLGIPLLIDRNATNQYPTLAVPVGTFFPTDDTGLGKEATLYSFGIDHSLFYVDPTQ